MAEVYKARLPGAHGLDKIVAIKRILPYHCEDSAFINMFLDEAKITLALSHPNIGQVYELNEVDGAYFICMEYIDGPNVSSALKHLYKGGRRMPLDLALHIMGRVAAGLFAAHTQTDGGEQQMNIIHRDVSPHNVLVSRRGDVKLIDFGIAKARDRLVQTMAGTVRGKLLYMSPEHAASQELDHRSDIFSAGMMLLTLLNGRHIWKGLDEVEVLVGIRRWKVPDLAEFRPDLSPEVVESLQAIVAKSMAYAAEDRYANAEEFRIDLNRLLNQINPVFSTVSLATFIQEILEGRQDIGDSLEGPGTDSRSGQASTPTGPSNSKAHLSDGARQRAVSGSVAPLQRPTAKVRTGLKGRSKLASAEGAHVTPNPLHSTPGVVIHAEKTELDTGSLQLVAQLEATPSPESTPKSPSRGGGAPRVVLIVIAAFALLMVLLAAGVLVFVWVGGPGGRSGGTTIDLAEEQLPTAGSAIPVPAAVEIDRADTTDADVLDEDDPEDDASEAYAVEADAESVEPSSTLRLTANVKGASIAIDGQQLLDTTGGRDDPVEITGLTAGQTYLIRLTKPGFNSEERRVTATGTESLVKFRLKRKAPETTVDKSLRPMGDLRVTTVPWAKVYANGRPVCGQTPCLVHLKPGRYRIKLVNPSVAAPLERSVEVRSGQTTTISERF